MRPDSNRLMLWLLWITATTLSMALLFGLALLLAMRGGMFLFLFAFLLVCWILGGLIVGQAQAVVLQVVGWPMRHWRRSTGIGWIM